MPYPSRGGPVDEFQVDLSFGTVAKGFGYLRPELTRGKLEEHHGEYWRGSGLHPREVRLNVFLEDGTGDDVTLGAVDVNLRIDKRHHVQVDRRRGVDQEGAYG